MLHHQGRSYSQDLRERVFASADDGNGVCRIADLLRVSPSYVSKVLTRRRLTGATTALPQRCHVAPKLTAVRSDLQARVAAQPDATIEDLKAWLHQTHKMSASTGLMWKTLAALGLTVKKNPFTRQSRRVQMSPRHVRNGGRSSRA